MPNREERESQADISQEIISAGKTLRININQFSLTFDYTENGRVELRDKSNVEMRRGRVVVPTDTYNKARDYAQAYFRNPASAQIELDVTTKQKNQVAEFHIKELKKMLDS
jgi:hypothetical protein